MSPVERVRKHEVSGGVLTRMTKLARALRVLWSPEVFHYHDTLRDGASRFEGWYFKVVDAAEQHPYAIIAGVILGVDRHAFVQVLEGRTGTAWYHRFPIEAFSARRDRFDVRIGRSRFHGAGIELDLDRTDLAGEHVLRGVLTFSSCIRWPSSLLSPGAMGPYAFVPFIECRHGILNLDGVVTGWLESKERVRYDGGRAYVEKDWGSSFPESYVWSQCNHFDRPGVSVAAAIGTSPWLGVRLRGFVVALALDGELHVFRSYLGAVIEELSVDEGSVTLCVRSRRHRLELRARRSQGALLLAPYDGQMRPRVAETMSSQLEVRFSTRSGTLLYAGSGRNAGLEVQTPPARQGVPLLSASRHPELPLVEPVPDPGE